MKNLVGSVRSGLSEFFRAPEGYEVVLGVGGSTAFWDIASFGLVENKAQHLSFGEFGSKFASATNKAPFLAESSIIKAEPGTRPTARAEAGVDVYAWPQNETSTGVAAPVQRVAGADDGSLVLGGRHLGGRRAGRGRGRSRTSTTSRRRRTSRPTAACGWACSPRPRWSGRPGSRPATAGSRTSWTSRRRSTIPG